jgi:hypothetical protein
MKECAAPTGSGRRGSSDKAANIPNSVHTPYPSPPQDSDPIDLNTLSGAGTQ